MSSLFKDLKEWMLIIGITLAVIFTIAIVIFLPRLFAMIRSRRSPSKPVNVALRPLRLIAIAAQRSASESPVLPTWPMIPSSSMPATVPWSPTLLGKLPSPILSPKVPFFGTPNPNPKALRPLLLPSMVAACTPRPSWTATCTTLFLFFSCAVYLVILYEHLLALYALQSFLARRLVETAVYGLSWSKSTFVYIAPPLLSLVGHVLGSQGLLGKVVRAYAQQDAELNALEEGQRHVLPDLQGVQPMRVFHVPGTNLILPTVPIVVICEV
ncbi:hypothetical protein OF83DRAFT_254415 [Amylostereum chailletii]|nr:hypothetical protein OF83DRAFT_254415 [Amylostereum chailletii]